MQNKVVYEFGDQKEIIWAGHLAIGLFLIYVGYELIMKQKVPVYMVLAMIILGALAFFYHAHMWYEDFKK